MKCDINICTYGIYFSFSFLYTHMYTCIYIHTYIHTVGYYLAKTKNEILSFVGKGMELEINILSKINPNRKHKYCILHVLSPVKILNL
jgi:hypothetical protein